MEINVSSSMACSWQQELVPRVLPIVRLVDPKRTNLPSRPRKRHPSHPRVAPAAPRRQSKKVGSRGPGSLSQRDQARVICRVPQSLVHPGCQSSNPCQKSTAWPVYLHLAVRVPMIPHSRSPPMTGQSCRSSRMCQSPQFMLRELGSCNRLGAATSVPPSLLDQSLL